jgi:hypothetical protein
MPAQSPSNILRDVLAQTPAVIHALPAGDWGAHISVLPITPTKAVALFDTGGTNPNPALLLDYQTVQIQVRGGKNDAMQTYAKAKEIKDRLLGCPSQDIDGDRLVSVGGIGDITFVGRDDNDQPIFSLNFRLIVEPATNALTNRIPV